MIVIKNVSKNFKHQELFNEINVEIPDGKFVYIKGVNGSGKSVLLKMISGYSKPTTGKILMDGKIIGKDTDFIPDAGIFINSPDFMGNWSGMDNIQYLANIRKIASDEDIIELANRLNLSIKDLKKKYRHYSQGMKQKVRLIQALMDKPRYLILDEPFDALDETSRRLVTNLLIEYRKENPEVTLLYTSHDLSTSTIADMSFEIDNKYLKGF